MEYANSIFSGYNWVDAAKVVWILLMWVFAALSICVALNFREWHEKLEHLEAVADQYSNEAMMDLTAARARLTIIKNRLFRAPEEASQSQELMKHAGRVVMMALSKERSMFQWGMLGLKVARSAWAYLKNK